MCVYNWIMHQKNIAETSNKEASSRKKHGRINSRGSKYSLHILIIVVVYFLRYV
jgi:hypothetical protein